MGHVGVDLHTRLSQIAVLTEDGELTQHRLANEPLRIERVFADFPAGTPVAIEASGTWWGTSRCSLIRSRPRPSRRPG